MAAGVMKPRRSGLQLRAGNARVSLMTKVNETESLKGDSTLPDWSKLLAVITTIFSAAEKQWTNLEWKPKPKPPHLLDDHFGLHGLVFRRTFAIRCYEVGPDRSTSMVAVMNHLQEAARNHANSVGILGDGFGTTLEMSKRDLIWVVRRTHIAVERLRVFDEIVLHFDKLSAMDGGWAHGLLFHLCSQGQTWEVRSGNPHAEHHPP